MNENEIIPILCEYFKSLFPKTCPCCNRCFETLREYILNTKRIGPPISFDAEFGDWETRQPIGTLVMANCSCGSTLALGTAEMALPLRLRLLRLVKIETKYRGISPSELIDYLRDEVRKQVLSEFISE